MRFGYRVVPKNLAHIDPVCGMETGDLLIAEYLGKSYYFCSDRCRKQFTSNPAEFVN